MAMLMRHIALWGLVLLIAVPGGAQTKARGPQPPTADLNVVINRGAGSTTLFRGNPLERDTTYKSTKATFHAIPDTMRTADFAADSLPVPANMPFLVFVEYSGTVSSDTLWLHGSKVSNTQAIFTAQGPKARQSLVAAGSGPQRVTGIWGSIDSVACPTSGADSIKIWIQWLNGVSAADSAETKVNSAGVVWSDSIPKDSIGYAVVRGPAQVLLNGNTVKINPGAYLGVGTSGFVAITQGDSNALAFTRDRLIWGRALTNSTTSADTGYIHLDALFGP